MTYPYEPTSLETAAIPKGENRSFYAGGFIPIGTVSIVIGGVVGAALFAYTWSWIPIFGIPAIGLLCATALLAYLIQSENCTVFGRVVLAFLLPIPAYILYVPVCVVSSMLTTPVLGGRDYGPNTAGATIGSAFAFFLTLMSIAVAVRAGFRVRKSPSPPHIDEQS